MTKHARDYYYNGIPFSLKDKQRVAVDKMREQLVRNNQEVIFHGRHRKDGAEQ